MWEYGKQFNSEKETEKKREEKKSVNKSEKNSNKIIKTISLKKWLLFTKEIFSWIKRQRTTQ